MEMIIMSSGGGVLVLLNPVRVIVHPDIAQKLLHTRT
jgi:hypothetical protein